MNCYIGNTSVEEGKEMILNPNDQINAIKSREF